MRPDLSRAAAFYHGYIEQVREEDLMEAFNVHTARFYQLLDTIPETLYDHRYAPEKWTIREVLQHIIDTERVFAYRALSFARKSTTPLPGFDENLFAANSKADKRKWDDLVNEFKNIRESSRLMYASFDEEQLESDGIANNSPTYVRALGYTLLGHVTHHINILNQRYLV
ncbi:MAG: DinB family protein [Chitinophagaceae bacterium]|nr:MAG: DinB family protein [Chitinophagaceae bacterium]